MQVVTAATTCLHLSCFLGLHGSIQLYHRKATATSQKLLLLSTDTVSEVPK
jgi:hypothetical protein